jgi:hypothetical protein
MLAEKDRQKRKQSRIPHHDRALLQLSVDSYDQLLPGETVSAKTMDVSVSGFRVISSHPMDPGTLHSICIAVTDHRRKYMLTAELVWLKERPGSNQSYMAGFHIVPSRGTDFEAWQDAFHGIENTETFH